MSAVGTLDWTRETRGLLRNRDRLALLGQACVYGLATLPWEVGRVLGLTKRGLAQIDPSELAPPDSHASREAEKLVDETTSAMVRNHSHRTFAFGAAIAAHDGLAFDREVAYVASLLHDLYWDKPDALPGPHCFTLPAVDKATALCESAGWDRARSEAAAEAITYHLNVWPPRKNPESYVVFLGARLDVVGYRHWHLHPRDIAEVIERHPRLDLKEKSYTGFDAQADANPGTRVHFHTRYLASKWFTRRAPFNE